VAENEGSDDFGGVLMRWSNKKRLVGFRMVPDVVNQRMIEISLQFRRDVSREAIDIKQP
jgi:hypothetical protein